MNRKMSGVITRGEPRCLGRLDKTGVELRDGRDHVELPEDFDERAAEIMERHRSSPVAEALRGGL
jgi:hypothetical protein